MTLDEHQRRDRRIDWLEAKGRGRTRDEDHEYGTLISRRDQNWRKFPARLAAARAKVAQLEAYARQAGFNFDERTTA